MLHLAWRAGRSSSLDTESTDAMGELNHCARAERHVDDSVIVPQSDPPKACPERVTPKALGAQDPKRQVDPSDSSACKSVAR